MSTGEKLEANCDLFLFQTFRTKDAAPSELTSDSSSNGPGPLGEEGLHVVPQPTESRAVSNKRENITRKKKEDEKIDGKEAH